MPRLSFEVIELDARGTLAASLLDEAGDEARGGLGPAHRAALLGWMSGPEGALDGIPSG